MSVQDVTLQCINGKLALRWKTMRDCAALSIHIAMDSEFTQNDLCYVLPRVDGANFDCGGGFWYVRFGAWIGDEKSGIVEWSGIYGPVAVINPNNINATKETPAKIINTQAIQKGLRLHTGNLTPMYFVIESSLDQKFPASATVTRYVYDYGKGYVDCLDLLFGKDYNVRFGAFVTEKLDKIEIRQLGEWQITRNKQAARPIRHGDNTQVAIGRADAVLLQEASQKKVVRFGSHSDYLRFKAAETRTREELN